MKNDIDSDQVSFPITVTFEDGSQQSYEDELDLECNLEDFDSSVDTDCTVKDAHGRIVTLVLKLLELKTMKLKEI